ncbi:MAG: DAK2 domain-containing protein [Clostridiales bacterium]|nr:DAK2 domain-containing protein [Clostridiales bacterium]
MKLDNIDGTKLREMLTSSVQFLDENKDIVDALNVFPVPDGDTGTNMSATLTSAAKEMGTANGASISEVANAISRGALKGARGNSGVILSQLFRGFAKGLEGKQNVNTLEYAEALKTGADTAYKAVMKPIEGTMLTVARVTAEEAIKIAKTDGNFISFYEKIVAVAKDTLDKTPDMLYALKEAGVVDSGGMGVLYILMGSSKALNGDFDYERFMIESKPEDVETQHAEVLDGDIKYQYCTEFLINDIYDHIKQGDIERLRSDIASYGDSMVFASDDDFIKVHVHTNDPGDVLQLGLKYGELSTIKIDNMKEQHRELGHIPHSDTAMPEKRIYKNKMGVVSVAIGQGIVSIFEDLMADYVVEGGQTMNPSIDDLLNAIDNVDAEEVFILPNNSNIILSAKQASEMSDRSIHVIPSKTIPQGLAAMIAYNPDMDVEVNIERMTKALDTVTTGQVTYAIRDTSIEDTIIKKDNIIGICNGQIVAVDTDISDAAEELIEKMIDISGGDFITIYYGEDIPEEDAEAIGETIEERYPDVDVEIYDGKQPIYYYIISIE